MLDFESGITSSFPHPQGKTVDHKENNPEETNGITICDTSWQWLQDGG